MMRNRRRHLGLSSAIFGLALALLASACSLEQQTPPGISGPSAFALDVVVTTSATVIQRDGASQAIVTVQVRDVAGKPAANQRFLLQASGPNGMVVSATEITTDGNGLASILITAPPSSSVGDLISVALTPVDGNGVAVQASRSLGIGLTPLNGTVPTASFAFAPAAPKVNEVVTFNAGASTDEGAACGTACTYRWNFGDGNTGTGMIVTKSYSASGNKTVTLTVIDAAGASSLPSTQTVAVAAPDLPSVGTVGVSPTPVKVGVSTNFDAGGATVGAGATLADYTWVWGDGTSTETTTAAQAKHTFDALGTYTVRTTVRDSLNRTATTTTSVKVE